MKAAAARGGLQRRQQIVQPGNPPPGELGCDTRQQRVKLEGQPVEAAGDTWQVERRAQPPRVHARRLAVRPIRS
jgi:hypothetical protein